jgi:hypothetical protein
MRKIAFMLTLCAAGLAAEPFGAVAAAATLGSVYNRCERVQMCGPGGCWLQKMCGRSCPDGISCFPLYGAYGPYGGVGYWAAYTYSGWGTRH